VLSKGTRTRKVSDKIIRDGEKGISLRGQLRKDVRRKNTLPKLFSQRQDNQTPVNKKRRANKENSFCSQKSVIMEKKKNAKGETNSSVLKGRERKSNLGRGGLGQFRGGVSGKAVLGG